MAKVIFEVDTEKKIISMVKDGQTISPSEVSLGYYTVPDCEDKMCQYAYVSYSQQEPDGLITNRYIGFKVGDTETEAKITNLNYSMAKELGKIDIRTRASMKLTEILGRKNMKKDMKDKTPEMKKECK